MLSLDFNEREFQLVFMSVEMAYELAERRIDGSAVLATTESAMREAEQLFAILQRLEGSRKDLFEKKGGWS